MLPLLLATLINLLGVLSEKGAQLGSSHFIVAVIEQAASVCALNLSFSTLTSSLLSKLQGLTFVYPTGVTVV